MTQILPARQAVEGLYQAAVTLAELLECYERAGLVKTPPEAAAYLAGHISAAQGYAAALADLLGLTPPRFDHADGDEHENDLWRSEILAALADPR